MAMIGNRRDAPGGVPREWCFSSPGISGFRSVLSRVVYDWEQAVQAQRGPPGNQIDLTAISALGNERRRWLGSGG
jgi:hypothetical protein